MLAAQRAVLRRYGLDKPGYRPRLARYIQHARKVFNADTAYIFVHSAGDDEVLLCLGQDGLVSKRNTLCFDRGTTLCSHTLLLGEGDVLVVPDLLKDWRFASNPNVLASGSRFYASAPLFLDSPDLSADAKVLIGSICIIAREPRYGHGDDLVQTLGEIAQMACESLEQEYQAKLAKKAQQIQRAITEMADCSWASSGRPDLATDSTTKPHQELANLQVKTIRDCLQGASATLIDVTAYRLSTVRHPSSSSSSSGSSRAATSLFSPLSNISSPRSPWKEPSDLAFGTLRLSSATSQEGLTKSGQDRSTWSSYSTYSTSTNCEDIFGAAYPTSPRRDGSFDSSAPGSSRHGRSSPDMRRTSGGHGATQADIDPLQMPSIFAQSEGGYVPSITGRGAIGQFLAEWRRERDLTGPTTAYVRGPFLIMSSDTSNTSTPSEEWDGSSTPASPKASRRPQDPLGSLFPTKDDGPKKPAMYLAVPITSDTDNPQATFLFLISFSEICVVEQTDINLIVACSRVMEATLLRQRARNADKTQLDFVRNVQHELRTPINGLAGITDLLRASVVSGGHGLDFTPGGFLSTALEGIRLAAGNISSILDDVLDFGDLSGIRSADAQVARLDELSLSPLLEEVGQEEVENAAIHLRHNAKLTSNQKNGHTFGLSDRDIDDKVDVRPPDFFVNVDPALQGMFRVDRTTMRKIFRKLLHNAFRFTTRDAEGQATVEVNVRPAKQSEVPPSSALSTFVGSGETQEVWVAFEFIDTGCGMEASFIRTRFLQPFAQGDSFQQGTGLGGAIASGLSHRLGGYLDVQSEVGQGTKITVVLPLVSLPSTPAACMPKPAMQVSHAAFVGFATSVTSCRLQILLRDHLASCGVPVVSSPEEADLILATSSHVQSLDALDFKVRPDARFVVVSSDPLERISQIRCLDSYMSHFFHPPFGHNSLASMTEFLATFKPVMLRLPPPPPHPYTRAPAVQKEQALSSETERPPLTPASEVLEQSSSASTEALNGLDTSFRVLAVEDNSTNMKILTTVLQRQGIEHYKAHDGPEAVEQFAKHRPHLVLLDISLPGFDGFEVCKRLRELEDAEDAESDNGKRAFERAKVIAVTALSSKEDQRNGLSLGMDEWHTKPMAPRLLQKVLKTCQNEIMVQREAAASGIGVAELS